MGKPIALVCFALVGLSGCQSGEDRLNNAAKAALASTMIDPTSFLTRDLRWGRDDAGARAVCGEVNGKNRMGAYVGFEAFVATGFEKGASPSVAINTAGVGDGGADQESASYQAMYQRYCELPAERTARLKAERDAEAEQKALDDAEKAAQAQRDEADRVQQEAVQSFAALYGTYAQGDGCGNLTNQMTIDSKSISILAGPTFFNYVHVEKIDEMHFDISGYYAGDDATGELEHKRIEVLSRSPRKLKAGITVFIDCGR